MLKAKQKLLIWPEVRTRGETVIIIIIIIIKTSIFCKSFPLQPFFFFSRTDYAIPQTFTVTSEHIRFYFLVLSVLHFLVVGSVR